MLTKSELLMEWQKITDEYINKETQLEEFVQKWLDGESSLSSNMIQQLIDKTNDQIKQLKRKADVLIEEYKNKEKEAQLINKGLLAAKKDIKKELNTNPDDIIITGGLLSEKAENSHLIGRTKTEEEKDLERSQLLAEIRDKVVKKKISLVDASRLRNDIDLVYGTLNKDNSKNR